MSENDDLKSDLGLFTETMRKMGLLTSVVQPSTQRSRRVNILQGI